MPNFFILLQQLLPQHLLSRLMGYLAESPNAWLKNWMIQQFIRHYHVDLSDALIQDPQDYKTFNQFFTRALKPTARPIETKSKAIVSPVDGYIAQIGYAQHDQLLQAKNFPFSLHTLLAGDTTLTNFFDNAAYATLYLAPHNYHRIHMPLAGALEKMIYVPGRLFSVNATTAEHIPNLYSNNERLITVFNTDIGKMAVILIGAMIVGSMQVAWKQKPFREKTLLTEIPSTPVHLSKGAELGYFRLGSTVILLFEKSKITWLPAWQQNAALQFGQMLAEII